MTTCQNQVSYIWLDLTILCKTRLVISEVISMYIFKRIMIYAMESACIHCVWANHGKYHNQKRSPLAKTTYPILLMSITLTSWNWLNPWNEPRITSISRFVVSIWALGYPWTSPENRVRIFLMVKIVRLRSFSHT